MDNAQKAIMIGVGLFITIIIISAVLLIVNLGTGLVDDATSELGTMSTTLQNQILQTYDGKIISGTQVRAAVQQYANDASLCIVLCSKEASATTTANTIVGRTGAKSVPAITGKIGSTNVRLNGTLTDFASVSGAGGSPRTTMTEFTNNLDVSGKFINTANNYNASVIKNANDTVIGIAFQPVFK